MSKKYFVYGANGFGREVVDLLRDIKGFSETELIDNVVLIDDDPELVNISGLSVIHSESFIPANGPVVVAVAHPLIRKKIVSSLPEGTQFYSLIHPSSIIGRNTEIGDGAIICAGTIVTCNISIGSHCHLNLATTIGHDCIIGDYFTTAPSVNVSGNCNIGEAVYLGTKAATKQGVNIASNVVVGMAANVLKSLEKEGVYVGTPAKLLSKT